MNMPDKTLPLRDCVILALLGAVTAGAQIAMAPLPNIEPVTLLLMCCAIVYGGRALYAVFVFVMLEGLVFGFGIWFFSYLYIWPALVIVTWALRKNTSYIIWAIVAAAFGLFFGALCALPYLPLGGWSAAAAYWVAGIPFDLIHGAGNAVMSALLLKPLVHVLEKLKNSCARA